MDYVHIPPPVTITVSTKGQVVIPLEIRRAIGLDEGTRVMLICHEDGTLELRPIKHSILELFGAAKPHVKKMHLGKSGKYTDEELIMNRILIEDENTKSKKGKKLL